MRSRSSLYRDDLPTIKETIMILFFGVKNIAVNYIEIITSENSQNFNRRQIMSIEGATTPHNFNLSPPTLPYEI